MFAGVSVASAADVNANCEEIKRAERAAKAAAAGDGSQAASAIDGVPFGPALSLAAQLQRRAERAGMTVPVGVAPDVGLDDESALDGEATLTAERLGAELMTLVARPGSRRGPRS